MILYLASQSPSRQRLLSECGINYEVIRHDSDECIVKGHLSFKEYVLAIAKEKMENAILPESFSLRDKEIFVLTSDSLVKCGGNILGKPVDRNDAVRMLKEIRDKQVDVVTACIVEKKIFDNGWKTLDMREICVESVVEFNVDDIDLYLQKIPQALKCSGAGFIEGFGGNFLKSINGSYTSVQGLPMYELRQTLQDMGFN